MDSYFILLVFIFLITIGHFIRTGDEIPVFIVLFTLLIFIRLTALESGKAEWIAFDYGINFEFDLKNAYIAWSLISIGTIILVVSYFVFYSPPRKYVNDSYEDLRLFLNIKEEVIFIGFGFFYIFKLFARSSLSHGYGFLLGLASNSFLILLILLYFNSKLNIVKKWGFGIGLIFLAISTYDVTTRFYFLGWSIPFLIYMFRNVSKISRTVYYSMGLVVISIIFSIGGILRGQELRDVHGQVTKSNIELVELATEALLVGNDINFIDGFVMLHQIYPNHLDYHLGTDHLSIFVRPIPRTIWPDKPPGGWVQKYAAKIKGPDFVTGISPTIYGVFYGEGGVIAIILFSIMYGYIFSRIKKYCDQYHSDLSYILKGIFLASLIPLMRSGDLPGDISIIGMSYWPIFIFVYQYNKFIKRKNLANV